MADFDWPADLAPSESEFWLQAHSAATESPFTRQRQVLGRSAPRWMCQMTFRKTENYQAGRIDAMLAKLRGQQKTVTLFDWRRPGSTPTNTHNAYALTVPRTRFSDGTMFSDGTQFYIRGLGVPRNIAAASGAASVEMQGCWPGRPPLDYGAYIGCGDDRCYQVVDYTLADVYGRATVTIEPALRTNWAADTIQFVQIRAKFRLTSDDAGRNPTSVDRLSTYTLDLAEDLS